MAHRGDLVNVIVIGIIAGLLFAFTRGFVQAALDDWRRWRSRGKDVVINNRDLANDQLFLDELGEAVQRSFRRR